MTEEQFWNLHPDVFTSLTIAWKHREIRARRLNADQLTPADEVDADPDEESALEIEREAAMWRQLAARTRAVPIS